MASLGARMRTGRARPPRGSGARLGPSANDFVIVSRALADLAEFLKLRQESASRGRVILDRRVAERRVIAVPVKRERRKADQRREPSRAADALMRVLGFMVVPGSDQPTASPRRRTAKPPARRHRAPGSRGAAPGHPARRRRP